MKVKCPICKGEEFESHGRVLLTKNNGCTTNAMNVFVCKKCGYVMAFDGETENVDKSYWPDAKEE